jgi:hypothetical protein
VPRQGISWPERRVLRARFWLLCRRPIAKRNSGGLSGADDIEDILAFRPHRPFPGYCALTVTGAPARIAARNSSAPQGLNGTVFAAVLTTKPLRRFVTYQLDLQRLAVLNSPSYPNRRPLPRRRMIPRESSGAVLLASGSSSGIRIVPARRCSKIEPTARSDCGAFTPGSEDWCDLPRRGKYVVIQFRPTAC